MRETITSILIGALAAVLVFASGYESGKVAERERMNEIVIKEQIDHAKSLAEATNTISAAAREYDSLKSERDALSGKLRQYASGSGKSSAERLDAERVARLETMVADLQRLVEGCDSGWHGCAARKDALSEAVK
jgi:hypothetical protein